MRSSFFSNSLPRTAEAAFSGQIPVTSLMRPFVSVMGRPASASPALTRPLRTTTPTTANLGSHMSDNDPVKMQKEKETALKGETVGVIPDVPGWNQELASVSEAVVKAEHTEMSMEEMREKTVKVVLQKFHQDDMAQGGIAGPEGPRDAARRERGDKTGLDMLSSSPSHRENLEHSGSNDPASHVGAGGRPQDRTGQRAK